MPRHVVADLQELGNWRARSAALVSLQQAVASLGGPAAPPPAALAPQLPGFVDFLMRVSGDTNFKVIIATLDIVAMAVERLGRELAPLLRCAACLVH